MEKNILKVLGDLIAIQNEFKLRDRYGGTLVECLLKSGNAYYEAELEDSEHYEDAAKFLRILGLSVKIEEKVVRDSQRSYHRTEYTDGRSMTVTLPVSPAIKVLYAKSNKTKT